MPDEKPIDEDVYLAAAKASDAALALFVSGWLPSPEATARHATHPGFRAAVASAYAAGYAQATDDIARERDAARTWHEGDE